MAATTPKTIRLSETKALEPGDLERLRRHATSVFERLEEESASDSLSPVPPSWVDGVRSDSEQSVGKKPCSSSFRKRHFDSNGFFVARRFCDPDEARTLKAAMSESVRKHWYPKGTTKPGTKHGGNEDEKEDDEQVATTFGTDAESNEARGDPFLESAATVAYFAEPTALDSETGALKPEFRDENCCRNGETFPKENRKLLALCKAGHGLHLPPSFRRGISNYDNDNDNDDDVHKPFFDYTTSDKLRELVLSLGYRDPVVPQSMYIFKNPVVGGAVHSHQDSTFLYTTPRQTCLGLWLALDDATLENGCLWVRPKSHFEPLRRQFIRNPRYNNKNDGKDSDGGESKLTFRTHHDHPEVTWEGGLPESVEAAASDTDCGDVSSLNFVPVEVQAGDLVVFCGTLDHFSLPNFSDRQRHTFQLHLVEGLDAGVAWSPENWLQYNEPTKSATTSTTIATDTVACNGQGSDKGDCDTTRGEREIQFLRLLDYAKEE